MNISSASLFKSSLSLSESEWLFAFMRSKFRAVLEPFGGQTVTFGKSRSEMGKVVTVVEIGDFCQDE